MKEFISDFNIFFNGIFGALQTLWDWLFSTTVLGKVILFTVLISIFIFIVLAIINFKQS
jgi:hypothetical protein